MSKNRKHYAPDMKFQVVLALLSGRMTQAEVTSEYWVHATQQNKRKQEFMKHWPGLFKDQRFKEQIENDHYKVVSKLHETIGQLTVERDWLQKKIGRFPGL